MRGWGTEGEGLINEGVGYRGGVGMGLFHLFF